MILLSEVADRIRNEIDSWPTQRKMPVLINIDPDLPDARKGTAGRLVEALAIPVGLIHSTAENLRIEITGTDELVHVTYHPGNPSSLPGLHASWNRLADTLCQWNPVIGNGERSITVTLRLPSAAGSPPLDITALARETGLGGEEIRELLVDLTGSIRSHLTVLRQETRSVEERFRAAHSLKGAGKALRAPELAAAAATVEKEVLNRTDFQVSLKHLEETWQRIDGWLTGMFFPEGSNEE